jgi:hypothetical protein
MKKFGVLVASFLGWISLACCLVYSLIALVTFHAKSYVGGALVVAVCTFAFWSFYSAYKKCRDDGVASFGDLYEVLAFRFCLTPILTFGTIMLVAVKMS